MQNKKFDSLLATFRNDLSEERIIKFHTELLTGKCITLNSLPLDVNGWNVFGLQRVEFNLKSDHGEEHSKKIVQFYFYIPFNNAETGEYRWESTYTVENNLNEYDEFYEWFTDDVAYSSELWQTGESEDIFVFADFEVETGEFRELIDYIKAKNSTTV